MHSIVISENSTVQNPSHSQDIALVVPTMYSKRHINANKTFVVMERTPRRDRYEADPMLSSNRVPMAGKLINNRIIVIKLFPTIGDKIKRYISKRINVYRGMFDK